MPVKENPALEQMFIKILTSELNFTQKVKQTRERKCKKKKILSEIYEKNSLRRHIKGKLLVRKGLSNFICILWLIFHAPLGGPAGVSCGW